VARGSGTGEYVEVNMSLRMAAEGIKGPVVDLPKPRKPEGRSRGGARDELPARSRTIANTIKLQS